MNENIHPKTTSSILKIDKVTHRYSVNEFFIRSLYRITSYLVKSMTNPLLIHYHEIYYKLKIIFSKGMKRFYKKKNKDNSIIAIKIR